MKSFQQYVDQIWDRPKNNLSEGYTIFPKNQKELNSAIKQFPPESQKDIKSLYKFLRKSHELPINLNAKEPKKVNVTRALQGTLDISDIKKKSNLETIKIKFGNGSLGNRGNNNQGNKFEKDFADALDNWYLGGKDEVGSDAALKTIIEMNKIYEWRTPIKFTKNFEARVDAAANTKRPILFNPIRLSNTKGKGNDIGKSVTDITVNADGEETYLSLKASSTTTFFNVGIKKILSTKEINEGRIKNKQGIQLLNLFGIDNKRFCTIYNPDVETKSGIVKVKPKDPKGLRVLLESGIGFGYHVVHKKGSKIFHKQMDRKTMQKAAKVGNLTIYYGGKSGKGKRIDIEMESPLYIFKINIRDTQGKDGYPTRMMCDFKDKI